MPKLSDLVKKVGKDVGEYFLGIEGYINNSQSYDILFGKVALTALTVLGASTIVSGILYPAPLKYDFGIATVVLTESFRSYFNTLKE